MSGEDRSNRAEQRSDQTDQRSYNQSSTVPHPQHKNNEKRLIKSKVTGLVKWFNVKRGFGFITRDDNGHDIFVHQTAIVKNNPDKYLRSVGDKENVEFDVVQGEKGEEAANVTGPNGQAVKGSQYAANRRPERINGNIDDQTSDQQVESAPQRGTRRGRGPRRGREFHHMQRHQGPPPHHQQYMNPPPFNNYGPPGMMPPPPFVGPHGMGPPPPPPGSMPHRGMPMNFMRGPGRPPFRGGIPYGRGYPPRRGRFMRPMNFQSMRRPFGFRYGRGPYRGQGQNFDPNRYNNRQYHDGNVDAQNDLQHQKA